MRFSIPPNKSYKSDIETLYRSIKNHEHISFSKFCDGEWAVICNQEINNKEFWFDPKKDIDQHKRRALIESFRYKNDRYFVGITCVKVFGLHTHRSMKDVCSQDEDHLTWADIWVNSNYSFYKERIIPLFSDRPVVLFCNKNGKINNLPFTPYAVFPLKNNAWEYNWDIVDSAKQFTSKLKSQGISNMIYLFCCGPFGNILCHQLTQHEPDNTYLDIGSTLNPYLQSAGFERDYYMGDNFFSKMVGAWEQ